MNRRLFRNFIDYVRFHQSAFGEFLPVWVQWPARVNPQECPNICNANIMQLIPLLYWACISVTNLSIVATFATFLGPSYNKPINQRDNSITACLHWNELGVTGVVQQCVLGPDSLSPTEDFLSVILATKPGATRGPWRWMPATRNPATDDDNIIT